MCIISNSCKFIFIHIPKNAGTTVTNVLSSLSRYNDIEIGGTQLGQAIEKQYKIRFGLSKHSPCLDVKEVVGQKVWAEYFKFAFVRNPYSRLFSVFKFLRAWDGWSGHEEFGKFSNFSDFLQSDIWKLGGGPDNIFLPQTHWLSTSGVGPADSVDFVGRCENLRGDLNKILARLGEREVVSTDMPHLNVSPALDAGVVDRELIDRVSEHYASDFDAFGYPYYSDRKASTTSVSKPQVPTERDDWNDEKEFAKTEGVCTLCGSKYVYTREKNPRDARLCASCGASGRAQAIGYFVGKIAKKVETGLVGYEPDKSIKILGMSDNGVYATRLGSLYDYENTFIHKDPLLDIRNPPARYRDTFDLVISSDVFEHVAEQCEVFFKNTFDLLKPGGVLLFTVPYRAQGEHLEHYPGLKDYDVERRGDGTFKVSLHFKDGTCSEAADPKFHGGPGQTLELRLFSKERLRKILDTVGFEDVSFNEEDIPSFGYCWGPGSRMITARRPV